MSREREVHRSRRSGHDHWYAEGGGVGKGLGQALYIRTIVPHMRLIGLGTLRHSRLHGHTGVHVNGRHGRGRRHRGRVGIITTAIVLVLQLSLAMRREALGLCIVEQLIGMNAVLGLVL